MKLKDKLNQLVMRHDWSTPKCHTIRHVYLRSNGVVTGRLPNGDKVSCKHSNMMLWRYV